MFYKIVGIQLFRNGSIVNGPNPFKPRNIIPFFRFRDIGDQTVYFYFLKRPEHYNQELLSHSFICLPLP